MEIYLRTDKILKLFLLLAIFFPFSLNYKIIEYLYSDFIKEDTISAENVEGGLIYKISYERYQITQNYLRILVTPELDESLYIYYSPISEKREDAYLLNSGKDEIPLYIHKAFTKSEADGFIYLTIACFSEECSFEFSILELDEIDLSRNGQYTYFTKDKKNTQNIFKIMRTDLENEEGFLTFWASGSKDIQMNVKYVNEPSEEETNINVFPLENGKYCFIKETDYPIDSEINTSMNYFIIEITSPANSLITVGSNLNLISNNNIINKYSANSKEIYGVLNNKSPKQCFDFLLDKTTKLKYYLNLFDFQKNLKIQVINKNGDEITNYDINNGKILLTITNANADNYFCITKKNNENIDASFALQLTYDIENNYYKNIYAPQINGYFYERFLEAGQFVFYTGLNSIKFKTELRYYLKINSGYPEMYFAKCETFPFCQFDLNRLPSGSIKTNKINDMSSYSIYKTEITNAISPDQYVLLVFCNAGKNCSFETNFYSELDKIVLPKEKKIYLSIMDEGQTNFVIKLNEENNYNQIFVDFLTYSGEINISYEAEGFKVREYISGNKKYFVLDKVGENKEVYFYVTGKMASHYSIDYKLIADDTNKIIMVEESGINYIETIEPKFGHKTISLINSRKSDNRNFLVNFFSLNCQISVTRKINEKEKKLENIDYLAQDIILQNEEEYNSEKYDYEMEILKMDNTTKFDTNWCMVYVSSTENNLDTDKNYQKRQLLAIEGVNNRIILNKFFPKIDYIYPHINPSGYVAINLNIRANSKIKVKINIENKTYKEINTAKSQYIIIEESVLRSDEYCPLVITKPNQVCNIIVELTLDSNFYEDEPMIELSFKSKEEIPIFIGKSKLTRDIITGNYYQYYFTEVGKNEEGYVNINFDYGNGNVYGRIIQKNIDEGSGWMNKFILPNENNNQLNYDFYNKKIYYNKENTENCDYGCYLFLKVEPYFSDDYYKKEDIAYPISLYIYSNDAINPLKPELLNSIDIPVNEYIIGDTTPSEIFNNFYTFWIPYDCKEVIFDFIGDSAYIYINIGDTKPTADKLDFSIKELNQNNILRITKEEILKIISRNDNSIKNVQLTIAVGAQYIDNLVSSLYSFRIRALRENEIELIPLTSDQNSLCDINGNNGECNFLITHHRKIDDQNNFFFSALELPNIEYNYYAYELDKDIINNRNNDKIKELISDKNKANWSSKKSKGNYLYINNSEINNKENGVYILLNLQINAKNMAEDENTIVSLLHTVYSYKGTISPNPSSLQLFMINNNNLNELYFNFAPYNQNLIIHIKSIIGEGKVYLDSSEQLQICKNSDKNSEDEITYYYFNNIGDSISLTIGNSEVFPLHIINSNSDLGFGFYIYFERESKIQNYHKLNYGQSSLFSFKDTDFPFVFYSKLPDKSHEVYLTIKLKSLNYKSSSDSMNYLKSEETENELPSFNEFSINGFVLDEEFIYSKKSKPDLAPDNNKAINGVYDPSDKVLKIQFTPEIIKNYNINGKNYLYLNIQNGNENKKYTESIMECNVLPSSIDGYFADINKYLNGKIPYQQNGYSRYEFNRINSLYKFMRIEFSSNSDKINFALNLNKGNNDHIDFYKNNTDFIYNEFYNGKSVIIIEFKDDNIKSVYLSVFNKQDSHINNEEKLSNFIFKYEIKENNDFNKIKPESSEISNYKYNRGAVNISIPNIVGLSAESSINYIFKLIPNDKVVQGENLYSIALFESEPIKIYRKSEKGLNKIQNLELTDIHNDKIYYVVINCEVKDNNNEEKFAFNYIYNPTNYQEKEEKKNKVSLAVVLTLIFVSVAIAIAFIIIFLWLRKGNIKRRIQLQELNQKLNENNVL